MTDHEADQSTDIDPALRRLAEAIRQRRNAAGTSDADLAAQIGYSREYISRAQRPRRGLPSAELIRALDKALNAHGTLIALHNEANAARQARRQVARSTTATPADGSLPCMNPVTGAPSAETWDLADLLTRSPISIPALSAMEVAAFEYVAQYPTTGPGGMIASVERQVSRLHHALAHPMPVAVRRRAVRLLGLLAGLVGQLYVDLGVMATRAQQLFGLGRLASAEVDDSDLAAWVIAAESIATFHEGLFTRTIELLDEASTLAGRGSSARRRAWIAAMRARALAAAEHKDGSMRELDRANSFLADPEPPAGNDFFDSARLDGMTGHTALLLGDTARADHLLSRALDKRAQTDAKGRAMLTLDRAACRISDGEPSEAVRFVVEALDLAQGALVRPIATRISQVRDGMNPWNATSAVIELDERLNESLRATIRTTEP